MAIQKTYIESNQSDNWQAPIIDKDLTTAPETPNGGDRYIIAGIGGAWSTGTINDVVEYTNSAWLFSTPTEGMKLYVDDENKYYLYNGSSWIEDTGGSGISNIVEDVDPQLGGNLDMNGHSIGGNTEAQLDEAVMRSGKNHDNIMINAFRIAINGSLTQFNMVDGIVDEYEDESGIDTGASTNEAYDSTDDYYSPSVNTDLKLLLNLNGNDEAVSTTDESNGNHTITFNGNAQLDTAQKKFGTASLLLDGTGDYISLSDSADWDVFASNSDNWTIGLFIRPAIITGSHTLINQYSNGDNQWLISKENAEIRLLVISGGNTLISTVVGGTLTQDNWHHIALCKVGNEYGLYLDENQVGYTQDDDILNLSAPLIFGAADGGIGAYFTGHMDGIRILKSNIFSASPNVGNTDTIVVPTSEISASLNMTLISDTFTADAQPDDARIVLLEENVSAITLNTDIKTYVSRDGGTTYSQGTLTDEGNYDADKQVLVANVDMSGQPAGTSMEYKIESLNQKNLKIHATGLSWD